MGVGLNVQEHEVNGVKVLRLEGRLDAVSSATLEKKMQDLLQHHQGGVLLDFTKIEYLSSAGMRLLLSTTKKFKQQGHMMGIFAIHEDVMEIIKMAGFEKILHIFSMEKEALSAVTSKKS